MKMIGDFSKLLQRDTGKKKLIPEIDGLRTLALLPVIFMHFNTNYKRYLGSELNSWYELIVNNGERGVFLFFAISGFILSLGFYNVLGKGGNIDYKSYLLKRLTRLEPPFIISILSLFFVVQFGFEGGWRALLSHLIPTLTYTHHMVYGYWSPINPVTWSLEVEIQFYLLIPFFCLFLFSKSTKFRFFLLTILIVVLPFFFVREGSVFLDNPYLKRSLPVFCSHFLVGLLFLNLYVSPFWERIKSSYTWDALGFISILIFIGCSLEAGRIVETIVLDLLIFIIFISVFKGVVLNKLFKLKPVVIFGGMCYSIYLLHYPIFFGVSKIGKYVLIQDNFLNYVFQFSLAFGLMLIIASIFFILFEKPFMRNDWWKLRKTSIQSSSKK